MCTETRIADIWIAGGMATMSTARCTIRGRVIGATCTATRTVGISIVGGTETMNTVEFTTRAATVITTERNNAPDVGTELGNTRLGRRVLQCDASGTRPMLMRMPACRSALMLSYKAGIWRSLT